MEALYIVSDWGAAIFIALSMFSLRQTVKWMMAGGKSTFGPFHNLPKIPIKEALLLQMRVAWTTWFGQGAESMQNAPGAGNVTSRSELYKLAEYAKTLTEDPVHYDQVVYAIRAVTWGRFTMFTAMIAFICTILCRLLPLMHC